jgi:hypothetical protein
MPQRIQAQPSQQLGGAIAEVPGSPAVGHFMEGDREKHWDCINRNIAKKLR